METYEDLRKLTVAELMQKYDKEAHYAQPGLNFYREEIARREADILNQAMLSNDQADAKHDHCDHSDDVSKCCCSHPAIILIRGPAYLFWTQLSYFARRRLMAVLEYRKHILVSRPRFDETRGVWIPYASVAWQGNEGYRFRRFSDLDKTFASEEEALGFGFVVARAWVDTQLAKNP